MNYPQWLLLVLIVIWVAAGIDMLLTHRERKPEVKE